MVYVFLESAKVFLKTHAWNLGVLNAKFIGKNKSDLENIDSFKQIFTNFHKNVLLKCPQYTIYLLRFIFHQELIIWEKALLMNDIH